MLLLSLFAPAIAAFRFFRRRAPALGLGLAIGFGILLPPHAQRLQAQQPNPIRLVPPGTPVPELDGATAWLNTGKPLTMKELRGKIVVIDFWTLCCINCMHIMPELTKLEEKYKNQLVVIGVHSGKFENERNSESIRKAILRYELKHPVVNDGEHKIWNTYGVDWWPTVVVIDPEGKLVRVMESETGFNAKSLDLAINNLVVKHRKNKTLDETPLRFDTAKFRDQPDTPLYFPGKVVADAKGGRLMIADSTHHRIVVTTLEGQKIAIAGTGYPGNKDGPFDKAQFDDPQGMAVNGDFVYVADRKNNTIRRLDLKTQMVRTIAGTGRQSANNGGAALDHGLNSPWDLWLDGTRLFIAMAGDHQIWTMNLKTSITAPFAGSGWRDEGLRDGPRPLAFFAQPSGLCADNKFMYVADCEVSAIRKVALDGSSPVETLVGRDLFVFGDRDGPGRVANETERKTKEALLQHAVGVAFYGNFVYIADTYNSKIRAIDLRNGAVSTFINGRAPKGQPPILDEPTGLSVANDKLYVADTNAHRIRVIDLKSRKIETLELKDVPPVEFKEQPKTKN